MSGVLENMAPFWAVVDASPALRNRLLEQGRELTEAIAATLVADGLDESRAEMLAEMLGAAMHLVFETGRRRVLAGHSVRAVRRSQRVVIDTVFDMLDNGIGEIGAGSRETGPAR